MLTIIEKKVNQYILVRIFILKERIYLVFSVGFQLGRFALNLKLVCKCFFFLYKNLDCLLCLVAYKLWINIFYLK